MVQGLSEPLKEEEYKLLDETIRKHIEIEYDMMIFLKKLLEKIVDERLKYAVRYILDDEKRHHVLLKGLQLVINKREMVSEFDWFEIVWKDFPFYF